MQLLWKTWFLLLLFSLSFLWPWRRARSVNLVWTCKVWERISPCSLSESSFIHLQRKHSFEAFAEGFFFISLGCTIKLCKALCSWLCEENGKRRKTWKSHLLVTATCLLDFPSSITSITSSGLETKRSVHPCSAKEKRRRKKKEGKISEVKHVATPCDHTQKQACDSLCPITWNAEWENMDTLANVPSLQLVTTRLPSSVPDITPHTTHPILEKISKLLWVLS